MSGASDQDRLKALDDRIRALKGPDAEEKRLQDTHYEQAHIGWRMVIELVSGLLIGFGIGYGLDRVFGTLPLFLVLFTMLGFAAGIRVMLRTAKEAQEQGEGDAHGGREEQ